MSLPRSIRGIDRTGERPEAKRKDGGGGGGIESGGEPEGLLEAELNRKGAPYAKLVDKLAEVGISETKPNDRNRLIRWKLTAAFLLACSEAIGSDTLRLD